MAYKTTKAIRDKQDNDFCYYAGAIYPRQGLEVSKERIDELVKNGHIAKIEEPIVDGIELDENNTVDEIKAKLDELGIGYSSRAKKAELLELLKGA